MFGIHDSFVKQCADFFPEEVIKLDVLQEECAELIQALSKLKRGESGALDKVKEEMAHVLISSAVVARTFGITEADMEKEANKKATKYNKNFKKGE